MVEISELVEGSLYWYVYVSPKGLNLQSVRLEVIRLEKLNNDDCDFKVIRKGGDNIFPTVAIRLEDEDYANLFHITQKDLAEKVWAKEFFKNFSYIHGMEFSDFVTLYRRIQTEHPEWII